MDRSRRTRRHHRYLFVFACVTPGGFPYRAYGHSLADEPARSTGASVNLRKR